MSHSFLPASLVLLAIAVTFSMSTNPPPPAAPEMTYTARDAAPEIMYAGEHIVMLDAETAKNTYGDYYINCSWKYHADEEAASAESMCARLSYDAFVMARDEGERRMIPTFWENTNNIFWRYKPACAFKVHCSRARK